VKFLLFTFLAVVGAIIAVLTSIQNGSLVRYLDTHPHPVYVPKITYALGHGYTVVGDLDEATTYYYRVAEQYPKSELAEPAYFNYLNALDELNTPRLEMATLYESYLSRFPEGPHAGMVKRRVYLCRTK